MEVPRRAKKVCLGKTLFFFFGKLLSNKSLTLAGWPPKKERKLGTLGIDRPEDGRMEG